MIIWDKTENYVKWREIGEFLKSTLRISQIDCDTRDELLPYQVAILEYINQRLITLGTSDMKALVSEVLKIYKHGADLIVGKRIPDLLREIGVYSTEDPEFDFGRFVFSWANFTTSLCMRLKFQYAYLFMPEYDGECCKCGAKGQTQGDYESWTSNAFPYDEEYDRSNYTRTNTAWQVAADRNCDCYRHQTE